VKNFLRFANHLPVRGRLSTIKRFLEDHNHLCQQIDSYNKFWQKYLTMSYSIFLFLVCFLSYVVFISPIKWFLRLEYSLVLSAHILLLIIITYSASSVSHFNHILFRDLNSVYVRNNFPIDIKFKVSFKFKIKWKITTISISQLLDYIEKLADNRIGFTLTNGVLIKRRTFEFVSKSIEQNVRKLSI